MNYLKSLFSKTLKISFILVFYVSMVMAENKISNAIMPVSYFVNHVEQLILLKKNLKISNRASIVGTSGMGKTQLARMYVAENKSKYNIIWFIDCNVNMEEQFTNLAKLINEKILDVNSVAKIVIDDDVVKNVKHFLSGRQDWLILFDNIKSGQNDGIKEFIEWEHNGNTIFCSQSMEFLPNITTMSPLKEEDVIELAGNMFDNDNIKDALFVSEKFKGYPVLTVQAAQLLNNIQGLEKEEYKKRIFAIKDKIKFNIEKSLSLMPKSTKSLIFQIALLNNQAFSKDFLKLITNNTDSLESDIYELSKFMLINNIDANDDNPIFAMHDVIVSKILEIIEKKDIKLCLNDMMDKLYKAIPGGIQEGYLYRSQPTYRSNLEILLKHAESNNCNILKILALKYYEADDYYDTLQFKKFSYIMKWYEDIKKNNKFDISSMTNEELEIYGKYVVLNGEYNKSILLNIDNAISLGIEAKDIFSLLSTNSSNISLFNTLYALSNNYVFKGLFVDSTKILEMSKKMLDSGAVNQNEAGLYYLAYARYYLANDLNDRALEFVNKDIEISKFHGLSLDDKLFTRTYITKSSVLNNLGRYQESLEQINMLIDMYKNANKNSTFFAEVYAEKAVSMLGLGKLEKAQENINKAVDIVTSNHKGDLENTQDYIFARVLYVHGNILLSLKEYKLAISKYEGSDGIYSNLYSERVSNIPGITRLYYNAVKASCYHKDKFWYKHFYRKLLRQKRVKKESIRELESVCKF